MMAIWLRTPALWRAFLASIALAAGTPSAVAQVAPLGTAPATPEPKADATAQPPAGAVGGMGDVNIYPKRVVIDDRQRIGSIGLFNRSAATGEYEISVTDMMMPEDGRLIELSSVTDEALRAKVHPAAPLLRWSPRRVTLAGNEAQTVRVMVNARPDTPAGEYRSHFMIISVPTDVDGGLSINEATGQTQNGIGVRIVPRFGISIPVILRIGETTLDVALDTPKMAAASVGALSNKAIAFTIKRNGTRSAFGDITITNGRAVVAEMKGIAVYTEVNRRMVSVPVDAKADPKLYAAGQKLTITYVDDDASPGKVLARTDFIVP